MSAPTSQSTGATLRAPVLSIEELCVAYGHVRAVVDFSLSVASGEVVALLGPNGAGKTTTLRAVSGLLSAQRGRVLLGGQNMSGRRPDQIVRAGLLRSKPLGNIKQTHVWHQHFQHRGSFGRTFSNPARIDRGSSQRPRTRDSWLRLE